MQTGDAHLNLWVQIQIRWLYHRGFFMSEKKLLREKINQHRQRLSVDAIEAAESSILKKIKQHLLFLQAHTCAVYCHLGNEVPTTRLLEFLIGNQVRVVIPKVSQQQLEFYEYRQEFLNTSAWGILEPDSTQCQRCSLSECDLVVVPGVAFDVNGGRLGRGAGFYDRALSELLLSAQRPYFIGLAYQFQMVESCFNESHDVMMDEVITDA
jgi:5-formyltetrahydrofolate cyclo-ligase